jgi:hypothetical protein
LLHFGECAAKKPSGQSEPQEWEKKSLGNHHIMTQQGLAEDESKPAPQERENHNDEEQRELKTVPWIE